MEDFRSGARSGRTRREQALSVACTALVLAGCTGELTGGSLATDPERARTTIAVAESAPAADAPFRGAGLFVWHSAAFRAADHGEAMRSLGFSWIAIDVHEGAETFDANERELDAGWADAWRAAGLRVGAWGSLIDDPEGEAAVAADVIERFGLELYVAHAGAEHVDLGAAEGTPPTSSERFVSAFRARHPVIPAAVAPIDRMDRIALDPAPFVGAGFAILPQAWWNEDDGLDPLSVTEAIETRGVDRARVHPTLGLWGGGTRARVPAASYLERLAAAETLGFSVYVAESVPALDWPAFRGAMR